MRWPRRSRRSERWRARGGCGWRSTPVRSSCVTWATTSGRRSSGVHGCGRSATAARCSCRTRRTYLSGDHLPTGAYLRDLGAHRLKDLAGAERVWQLCHGDVESTSGRCGRLDAFGHNLPTRLTSLIGREADTAAVIAALGDSRLVTLVGTGGVGKSRLALQVAAESLERFDGGVWWVELATVSDPTSLPGAVLTAIGVPARPGRRPVRLVADHVGDRAMLFVLDNCEHVIAATASFVDEVLTTLAAVIVLATSREPLSVPGETVWRVPSLDVPDPSLVQTPLSRSNDPTPPDCSSIERAGLDPISLSPTPVLTPWLGSVATRWDSAVDRAGRRPMSQSGGRANRPRARRPLPVAHRRRPYGVGAPADAQGVARLEPRSARRV